MPIHLEHRPADVRGVLDEFEGLLLRERSVQEGAAGAYTARVAGSVAWLSAPTKESLRRLTAARVVKWVNLGAGASGDREAVRRSRPAFPEGAE